MIDLSKVKKIYFVGIGGIGMSAVAGIAKALGYEVSGSDAEDLYQPSKAVLDRNNIFYSTGFNAANLKDPDLVVTTSAVDQTNPEVAAALQRNIPTTSFPELLAQLIAGKSQILVVGTHGKGTTSGFIGYALKNLEDSGFFVGAVLTDLQTNYYFGSGEHFVIEGDEYKTSHNDLTPKFAYFNPQILLINNIEFDHPDLYPDIAAFKKPFAEMADKMHNNSTIVYNADDQNVLDVIQNSKVKKIAYSMGKSQSFDIKLPGKAYQYDALAAATVLQELGYKPEQFLKLFREYSGVKRRYEIIYDREITIIDDYAHHPTAVKETLEATRLKYPGRRIICFFEPHTYSRTKQTLAGLEQAFGAADLAYIAEIYPAREQKLPSSITGEQVVAAVAKYQPNVHYVADKADALAKFKDTAKSGDVAIVMAVGSFNTLVYDLKAIYAK